MILVSSNFIVSLSTSIIFYSSGSRNIPTSKLKTQLSKCSNEGEDSITNKYQKRRCGCFDLHKELVPYTEAWDWQKEVVKKKKTLKEKNEDLEDSVFVLQHPHVYTLGTGSSKDNFKFEIEDSPFDIYQTERGGEVTYHGPGQLVMYPIINLRYHKMDLHWYMRSLEEVIIRVLYSSFSIKASRVDGFTGVWVGDQKLAAIGVRVSQWITYHGLALNVTTDLTPFQQIVPCGIRNRSVGSIKGLLVNQCSGYDDDAELIDITYNSLIYEFSQVFQLELHQEPVVSLQELKAVSSK